MRRIGRNVTKAILHPSTNEIQKRVVKTKIQGIGSRLFFSSSSSSSSLSDQSNPVMQWLISKGIEEKVAIGIIKSFPSPPTISELQSFGMIGIKALADAVKQEQAKKSSNAIKVPIFIHIAKENRAFTLEAEVGQSFYELTQEYPEELGPYLECACRGIAACSTCHVYIGSGGDNNGSDQSEKDFLSKLPPPEENELDMLDLAWGYHPKTSRLGCQIKINESLRGLTVTIPEGVNNLYS